MEKISKIMNVARINSYLFFPEISLLKNLTFEVFCLH